MSTKNGQNPSYEESVQQAAIEDPIENGNSIDKAAAELGLDPEDLRAWKRKRGAGGKPLKTLRRMAQLRAENAALRSQIVSLEGQWDVLRSTLGMLSTTVSSHEMI